MKIKAYMLLAILLLNIAFMASVIPVHAVTQYVKILNPATLNENFTYYTNINPFLESGDPGYPAGNQFTANVSLFNINEVTGYQVNVTWNPVLLKVNDIVKPLDYIFAGKTVFDVAKDINNTSGQLLFTIALGIGQTPPNVTEGRLCQIMFERIKEPPRYGILQCPIHIVMKGETDFYTKITTTGGDVEDFTPVHGLYRYIWTPPSTKPYLELRPAYTEMGGGGPIVGTPEAQFTVDVYIRNLDKNWQLIGIQWKIVNFNRSLIAPISATEGPFMASYATNGTQWIYIDDTSELVFGVLIKPNLPDPPYWDLPAYPTANGVGGKVGSITWEVAYQAMMPWSDSSNIDIVSLYGEWGIDSELKYIPFTPGTNATCTVYGYALGRQIDVYTHYPKPYGGQGINKTSDMFWPQKDVYLWAYVTYNQDPVQSKPVTFEIISPTGLYRFVFTNLTGSNGLAYIRFGLPWPCVDPETEIFGVWTVVVSVDIRCEIVKDWLWFKVWWRVEATSVTPKVTEYKKGTTAEFDIAFRSYTEQPFWALITVTVTDDLDVPIGSNWEWVYVGPVSREEWCRWWDDTITLGVFIPKWAFVGTGKVYVSILSIFPSLCGTSFCPEATATFRILRPI